MKIRFLCLLEGKNEMEIFKFFIMCLLVANAGYDVGKCVWRLWSMR